MSLQSRVIHCVAFPTASCADFHLSCVLVSGFAAKKVWPVMYKAIVSAGAVKKNPEKRSAVSSVL